MYLNRNGEFSYGEPKPKLCDNGLKAHLGQPIFSPACFRETEAVAEVTILYHELESDTLRLCDNCAKLAKRSARKHGYHVKVRRL